MVREHRIKYANAEQKEPENAQRSKQIAMAKKNSMVRSPSTKMEAE